MGIAPMKSLQCHEITISGDAFMAHETTHVIPSISFRGIFHWSDLTFHGSIIDVSWHTSLLVISHTCTCHCSYFSHLDMTCLLTRTNIRMYAYSILQYISNTTETSTFTGYIAAVAYSSKVITSYFPATHLVFHTSQTT